MNDLTQLALLSAASSGAAVVLAAGVLRWLTWFIEAGVRPGCPNCGNVNSANCNWCRGA